jgi:hypothetical protein
VGSHQATLDLMDAGRFGEEKARPVLDSLPIPAKREIVKLIFVTSISTSRSTDSPGGPPLRSGSRQRTSGRTLSSVPRADPVPRRRPDPRAVPARSVVDRR